jgi:hypothetical protein
VAAAEHRPRRRLYKLTAQGAQAHVSANQPERAQNAALRKGAASA